MKRFITSVAASVGVAAFILYAYYGTIHPCLMLAHERKGVLEQLFAKDPAQMSPTECAAALSGEWWTAAQSFWRGRPAKED